MPVSTLPRREAATLPTRPPGGRVVIRPAFERACRELGLTTAAAFLELPGEVVSGHPDRHVARVELPGFARPLYLKRQHRVGWREKLRNRLAGFGWVSRCEREAAILEELKGEGFPCPRWVAYGHDRDRAFVLIEELILVPKLCLGTVLRETPFRSSTLAKRSLADRRSQTEFGNEGLGVVELRHLLRDSGLSPDERRRLAERLGVAVAELHAAGFDTPDLTAKHVFVDPDSFEMTLIDWQSARRVSRLGWSARVTALAALHASLTDELADAGERLRFLWAYQRVARRHGFVGRGFATAVRRMAMKLATRRSIRDQRQPTVTGVEQRLVWLASEAVCAVPDVAAVWPEPAVAPPFYDPTAPDESESLIELPDGRTGRLVRGRSHAPFARFAAWVRGRPWRSPGATLGRVLFHLQRYGIPAPKLLAFGQRETGRATAEWFALWEPLDGKPVGVEHHAAAVRLLRQLHDAGCRLTTPRHAFRVDAAGRVVVADPRAVRIVRRVSDRARRTDLAALVAACRGVRP